MLASMSGKNNTAASNPPMKPNTLLLLILPFFGALLLSGCFRHHQQKSYSRIIDEGDPNPYIIDNPTRAGTVVRRADTPR
jgi:hypothetical protein